jgi:iron complex transport system permease protein
MTATPLARRTGPIFAALTAAVLLLALAELSVGAVAVPLQAILDVFTGAGAAQEVWRNILLEFRLPRTLNALVSGAALGAAGLVLQTLFRNPLADPYVLGIVHGARLGAAAIVVFTGVTGNALLLRYGLVGDIGLALASVAGCAAVLFVLTVLSARVSTVTLLLVGVMLGYLAVGLISASLHFVDETQARAFKAWDDASFAGATHQQLRILVPGLLLGMASLAAMIRPLNALLLGERYAESLGIAVQRSKRWLLFVCAWLCGLVGAFCGPVAFLGLVAAQLARGLFQSSDHRVLLPGAALLGAGVGLAADLVTHLPWARHVFHLNAVIGLLGAPIALIVLLRSRALRQIE